MTRLSDDDFADVVRRTPLVSIDLVLRDGEGACLVGYRTNEPAKDCYFVPGGVIRKNEKIADAFARILAAETGLETPFSAARLLGAYEHFYAANRFGDPGYGTHYVVLAHALSFAVRPALRLDAQHRDFLWLSPAEILAAPNVHANTKAYFRPRPTA